jgi:hypothetical protein
MKGGSMWYSGLAEHLSRSLNIRQRLISARLSRAANASRQHAREFVTKHVPVILSLTSHGNRINTAHIAIETLLRQTAAAERLILWVSDEYSIAGLPAPLQRQMRRGLDVRLVPDVGPYTKIIYALREFPEHTIVTVDDDSVYAADLLGRLHDAYTVQPDCVHCHRAHEMTFDENGCLNPYSAWRRQVDDNGAPSHMIFPTGVGGVLYPPGALHPEVFNQEVFRAICPTADDVWLKAMALLNGVKSKRMPGPHREFPLVFGTKASGLFYNNICEKRNDCQIEAVFTRYGLLKRLQGLS